MSCIHFKFKSSLEYEKVTFDGLQISLGELKESIMKQKKIGLSNQYTLNVVDAQSKKVYEKDDEMLSRNSSVIISRVPLVNAPKIPKTQLKDPSLPQPATSSAVSGVPSTSLPALTSEQRPQQQKLTAEELIKTADLSSANATEEEKVMAMMSQSSEGYNPSQYVKFPARRGGGMMGAGMVNKVPPPSYRCYRCGQTGHFINMCPTNGDPKFDNYRYKHVRGTPSNQIISVPTDMPGAMLDRHGNLVVRAVDYQAYLQSQMKGKKTVAPVEAPKEAEIPPELICNLCKKLVKDAVIIPCCGESFCYDCIQEHLCDNGFTCPMCNATDVSPEKLAPNKALRASAKNFQMKAAEKKSEALARGFIKQTPPSAVLLNSTKTIISQTLPSTCTITSTPPISSTASTTVSMATAMSTTSQSQESSSSSTTDTSLSSNSQKKSTENDLSDSKTTPAPKVEEAKPSAPQPLKEGKSLATGRSLSPALDIKKSGVVTSDLMVNGLAGLSTGSVPVVKTDAISSSMAHLLHPGMLAPPTVHPAHMAALLKPVVPVSSMAAGKNISDSAKLDRMTADLLLGPPPSSLKKSPSPPPLSAEEFYRQQKLLKLLTKKTNSRSNTPGSNSSWSGSRSSPSYSDSRSRSRSHSRSWSYDSRSRSRSPYHSSKKHSSHKSSKQRSSHRPSRRHEKEMEKSHGKESSRSRHHRKRTRHESKDKKEEESKRTSKRHRSRTRSPERKKRKEDVLLVRESLLSPETGLSTPILSEGEEGGKSHRHKHKKRSKRKHKHRTKESEDKLSLDDLAKLESKVDDLKMTVDTSSKDETMKLDTLQEDKQEISTLPISVPEDESMEQTDDTRLEEESLNLTEAMSQDVENVPESTEIVPSQDLVSLPDVKQNGDTANSTQSDSSVPEQSVTSQPASDNEDIEESLLLDMHIDDTIDGLEEELRGEPPKAKGDSLKKNVSHDDEKTDRDEQDQADSEREDGELSDSGDASSPPQVIQSPFKQQNHTHEPHPPPSAQEDLRAEIERAKKKKESSLANSHSLSLSVKEKHSKPVSKKRKHREDTPPSDDEISDEYDSSSSSSYSESEELAVERKKLKTSKHSKHKHSTKSKERERELLKRELEKELKKEMELEKAKKRERAKAKKEYREKKLSKKSKDKTHEKERKLKRKKVKKSSSSKKSSSRH